MRRTATKAVKVQPGDEVVVQAELSPDTTLARLYVWAKEFECDEFSPYVQGTDVIAVNGQPQMLSPLSMRLVPQRSSHQIRFQVEYKGPGYYCQDRLLAVVNSLKVHLDLKMGSTSKFGRFKQD